MSPTVKVAQGLLEGVEVAGLDGAYVAFKGVPYAQPPIGKLRFKAPQPLDVWSGVRPAKEHGPVCPQYDDRYDCILPGSEDCLYLNVYTTNLSPPQPRPVMVWIHGGGFYSGSGDSDYYGPDFLVQKDIVLVTFNYRLEVLGFLCLDTEAVPGNAGLKDQVAALKWVQTNIAAFGGDPNNVTLFGCSAGGASIGHHLMSPRSAGLFHKAICMSGTSLHDWAYNLYPRQRAFQLGKTLGIDTDDPQELLDFLMDIPVQSLVKIRLPMLPVENYDILDGILFGPVIEKAELNVEHFICKQTSEVLREGGGSRVPLLLGWTAGDGVELARAAAAVLPLLQVPPSLVPRDLKLALSPAHLLQLDRQIRSHYFTDETIDLDKIQEIVDYFTDAVFGYNTMRFGRAAACGGSRVFLYRFSVESERNIVSQRYGVKGARGACHADDVPYLFHITRPATPPLDEALRAFVDRQVTIWTNFAKTGEPSTPSEAVWPAISRDAVCFMDIGTELTLHTDLTNFEFWDKIYGDRVLC